MPAPKSVTKISYKEGKTSVTYTTDVDATQYYMHELSRAAMRDVGKFIAKTFKGLYYDHFTRRTGNAGRATKYKVMASAKTTNPRVQVGLPTGRVDGFYAYFQEFGTKDGRVPKLGLLTKSAKDNIAKIIEIESQYLSGLSGEAARLAAQIDEKDMEGDGDD